MFNISARKQHRTQKFPFEGASYLYNHNFLLSSKTGNIFGLYQRFSTERTVHPQGVPEIFEGRTNVMGCTRFKNESLFWKMIIKERSLKVKTFSGKNRCPKSLSFEIGV